MGLGGVICGSWNVLEIWYTEPGLVLERYLRK